MYFCASLSAASAFGPAPPPPPPAAAAAASAVAAAGGAAAACSTAAGGADPALASRPLASLEPHAVAAAVLRGGALDVRDPFAELLRVGDRLAACDALLLDLLGGVEEPLDLQLGLLGEALVVALVPDPDAHLEEADGVGVAVVEVLDAGLHERRHHRQLLREPALLGLLAHPRRELCLRRVVARVAARAPGAVGGRAGDVRDAGAARRGRGGGCGGRGRGRRVAADADELDVRAARLARDVHDRVLVVALQGGELAVLDLALEEADVPVGAEVLLAAPVIGDDVAGAGVLGADDLEVVLARLGVADPRLHRGPAAALHLVAVLGQRPRHEARAPRVAGRHARRLEVLVDLGAGVGALLLDAELGLGGLQRRRTEGAAPRARQRRGGGVDRGRHRPRAAPARSPAPRAARP